MMPQRFGGSLTLPAREEWEGEAPAEPVGNAKRHGVMQWTGGFRMSRLTYPLLVAGAIIVAAAIVVFGTEFVLRRRGRRRFWGKLVATALALLGLSVGAMNMACPKPTCYAQVDTTQHKRADVRETHKRLVQQFDELKKMREKGTVSGPAFDKIVETIKADIASLRNKLKTDNELVTGAGLQPTEVEKLCSDVDKLLEEIKNQPVVMCYEPANVRPIESYNLKTGYQRLKIQYDTLTEMHANGTVKGDAYNKVVISIHDDLTKISDALAKDPEEVKNAGLNKDEAQKLCNDVEALLKKIEAEKK
jgi:hypothetical protein